MMAYKPAYQLLPDFFCYPIPIFLEFHYIFFTNIIDIFTTVIKLQHKQKNKTFQDLTLQNDFCESLIMIVALWFIIISVIFLKYLNLEF